MTNTPDKSEMKAMTSNRPVSEMVECEPCPFCGAATTLPPNTPYIRHPPNGCYFANHNIRFQNWQKRASSQAPSDDVKARNLTRMQDGRIMTDEICERLREPHWMPDADYMRSPESISGTVKLMREERFEAADLIQQQLATIERLSAALERAGRVGDVVRLGQDVK